MNYVVFLHGYGANKEDLMPLEGHLKSHDNQKFIFIDAPINLPFGFNSRAWFEITSQHFQQLAQQGSGKFSEYIPPELDTNLDYIAMEIDKSGFDYKNDELILAGFSQGSMCALQFYNKFYHRFSFAGLVLLSSHLVASGILNLSTLPKVPVFQSHGVVDPVLKIEEGERVKDVLLQNGFEVEYHSFNGGHGIPMEVIIPLKKFLFEKYTC